MKKIIYVILSLVLLSSCATQERITYFQNNQIGVDYKSATGGEIRLQPDDMLSIQVSSKDPELASVFNIRSASSVSASGASVGSTSGSSSNDRVLAYTVNPEGKINYPIFGELEVAGLTKFELEDMIKRKIVESEMIKDPIVVAEFVNLSFSTLGEVSSPGTYSITKDKTTILEALSMSGDLTITGLRDKVFVTRNTDGVLKTYQLNLKSTDIYMSPAFYVKQNDVIYVEPSKVRANQSTVNANSLSTPTFWMSLTSFLLTIALLFTAN